MARKTSFGIVSSSDINKEQKVPIVIIKEKKNGNNIYEGFVPGLIFNSVFASTPEEVQEQVKNKTVQELKNLAITNKPLPFFPSAEEIKQDFKNVVKIVYLKIKTK